MENEKDFDPETMTRATHEDVVRMWVRLWGVWPVIRYSYSRREGFEILDLTQV